MTRASYHVDHEPPFRDLVQKFIATEEIKVHDVRLGGGADNETMDYFEDPLLVEKFAAFHRANANLRIVTPSSNLRRRRKCD